MTSNVFSLARDIQNSVQSITNYSRIKSVTSIGNIGGDYMVNAKATLSYLIMADNVIRDTDTRKLSAIGIFQEINLPKGIETIAINFFALARVKNMKSGTVDISIKIIDPQGKEFAKSNIEKAELIGGDLDIIVNFNNTILSAGNLGVYQFEVYVNNIKLSGSYEPSITFKQVLDEK